MNNDVTLSSLDIQSQTYDFEEKEKYENYIKNQKIQVIAFTALAIFAAFIGLGAFASIVTVGILMSVLPPIVAIASMAAAAPPILAIAFSTNLAIIAMSNIFIRIQDEKTADLSGTTNRKERLIRFDSINGFLESLDLN